MPIEHFIFSFRAMGGENEIQIYSADWTVAEQVAQKAVREVERIEKKFSRYLADSVVSKINASAGKIALAVDAETAALLDYADACFRQSGGLFDITSGVLRRVWNFREKKLPQNGELKAILPLIGWQRVLWKKPWLLLPKEGMELDFGGIGKEYAVDAAAALLVEEGATHSLVNLAGDIRVCGPRAEHIPWNVGIADPCRSGNLLGGIALSSGALATSGDYERMIEIDDRRYSHLLNPKTGWPAEGLQSVSVVAPSCLIAGSLTTTAMLRGNRGERYLEELGVPYVLVTSEGQVRCSRSMNKMLIREEPAAVLGKSPYEVEKMSKTA